jgi:CheY-like chemotaxis protein
MSEPIGSVVGRIPPDGVPFRLDIPCNRRRILLVDDEPMVLETFQMVLSPELPEARIDTARDGREALEVFGTGHHAVLLMDLRMPVMDGRATFAAIEQVCRERHWECPAVVFCTGFAPTDAVRDLIRRSAKHGLLSKPVNNARLVAAVRSRLG